MFTVPGWNVSAPIATQVEKPKPKDPNKLGKKALKRKEKQEQQVNAENIGELWDKVVDGKGSVVEEKPATATNGVEETGDGAQEKRGKKRKRGKSSKQKAEEAASRENDDSIATEKDASVKAPDASAQKPANTDSEAKRDKKKRKKDNKAQANGDDAKPAGKELIQSTDLTSLIPEPAGLTPLQRSMRAKLASARFRHLNESLYTKPSVDSLSLFKEDPSMFEDYHRGFAQQVEVWPSNPVDEYVESILARGKVRNRDPWKDAQRKAKGKGKGGKEPDKEPEVTAVGVRLTGNSKPLPRNHKHQATIADLGCGTASLSYRLQPHLNDLHLTLHSFDLSKPTGPSAPLVTVADIANLPLQDGSVDVAIFCLALMGTNWLDFIDEAYRILRWRGELWVSEIKSRFGRVERKKGGVPINSIGSLKKPEKKNKSKKGKDKPEEEGIVDSADESELAQVVDGVAGAEGTDVSAFVEVLRKRGFVLDALPEKQNDAIDLTNKMFVKMQFVKSAPAIKGKNAKEGAAAKAEGKFETSRAMKFGMKGKKLNAIAGDDEADDEKEMKVLKPCLYKIR
ncbi:ribosomal RNA-processing protein 8 [Parastagonospora nodorum]|nr:ribosomal RNA-processing protein 8 [Parastagonospora nodorum]KAH5635163.1 ribosomal RNA-processing protein 8 [Parastagonospora nodorum]KAH5743588.1 ribosomal RNA-processing protein 8 [Parastagonospora nodorum]KAH6454056.1 ribosomal RNA-processing protein 8 [Parastagonospora nodorum]KAH6460245.1 ribosomal RNA-processing protein 8 [Parastagonospora nodorum]